uniref:Uncharacterized protein n=1 Tax=Strongyloides papillosus TaxID=174720 RepID=A0A0N5C284_STREA
MKGDDELCLESIKVPLILNDIRVDEFFTKVLQRHPNIKEIELFPGGEYKIDGCTEKLSLFNPMPIKICRNGDNDAIVIVSDEETDDSFFESLPPLEIDDGENNENQLLSIGKFNSKSIEHSAIIDNSDDKSPAKSPILREMNNRSKKIPVEKSYNAQSR